MKHISRIRIWTIFIFMYASSATYAECIPGSTPVCVNVTINHIQAYTNSEFVIGTSGNESLLSCLAIQGSLLRLNPAEANFKDVYAMLLSANLIGKPVTIRLDDAQSNCYILYVTVN